MARTQGLAGRIGAVALAIGVLAGAAAPAVAEEGRHLWPTPRWYPFCLNMSDAQIRQLVRDAGYHNIYLNVENDHRIEVRAAKKGWVYLLTVNTCRARIIDRERLRRE